VHVGRRKNRDLRTPRGFEQSSARRQSSAWGKCSLRLKRMTRAPPETAIAA
jgi:hypothetical protein